MAIVNLSVLLIATKQLGGEIWGQISLLVLNISIIHTVNEMYTGAFLVYFIPKISLGKTYRVGFLWSIISTLTISIIFFAFPIGIRQLWIHGFVLSFLVTLHSYHLVILLAKQKIQHYNILLFMQPALLLGVLISGIFISHSKTLDTYVYAMYCSFIIPVIISSYYINLEIKADEFKNKLAPFFEIFKTGFINQLGNLAHTLSNRFNYYLLGSSILVGVYSGATSLIESLWIISGSASPIILSHIANQNDTTNNGRVTFLLSKLCFIISCICVIVLYFLPNSLFTYFLGNDFSQAKSLMLHLSPGVLCISFSNIISHYFSGLGKQKILLMANGLGLLATVGTSYFFIQTFGILGACYTASLSYFIQALVLVMVFMKMNGFTFLDFFKLNLEIKLLR